LMRSIRRTKISSLKCIGLEGTANAVSIVERPSCVEERAVPDD
jgi:hypothetical protein